MRITVIVIILTTKYANFLDRCFKKCALHDGYATTEVPDVASNNVIFSSTQVKLVDWEEFSVNDKPYPKKVASCIILVESQNGFTNSK